ncbi:hypothetical protein [Synechococcus phage Ssp-JY39]|nr:hypothetical protein [Synechococcus phage Yong-M2-251]
MTKAFLPEYGQMPFGEKYRPLFKLFAGENWRFVRKDGKPVEYDTAGQAVDAAKECVKRILNPAIRSEEIEAPSSDALAGEAAAFLARRDQEAEEQKARVFASMSMVFLKGGRTVAVERRRRA